MDKRDPEYLRQYFQKKEVQERIYETIARVRTEATVTIGRVSKLFGFSPDQLRDWEDRGLLTTKRSKEESGQRLYSADELEKLALILELFNANVRPSEIPLNLENIWREVVSFREKQGSPPSEHQNSVEHLHIEQQVEIGYYTKLFWRYYASHILRLSLKLICEDIHDVVAGLVLPLTSSPRTSAPRSEDLLGIGESLIGWLGQTGTFYTFIDQTPSFEYPSDYRALPLQAKGENVPKDGTLLIIERTSVKRLNLSIAVVETIRRLLAMLYEDIKVWRPYFGQRMHELIDPAFDFNSNTNRSDVILNGLANMVVRLGGQTVEGQGRWRFCCILLPKDPLLPLQQRRLVVQAQSKDAPHKVGATTVFPDKYVNGASIRAFQSGHIVSQTEVSAAGTEIALGGLAGPIRSRIALSVGGESGEPIGVLYVASYQGNAFSEEDQRVLRMMARMVEEVLLTYYVRQQVTQNLADMIRYPSTIDPLFADFLSENAFVRDVDTLLTDIQKHMKEKEKTTAEEGMLNDTDVILEEFISFIAVDIDNQALLSNRYGDRVTRKLSQEVGLRLSAFFREHPDRRVYHIYADRFYVLLKGMVLEQAREKALTLIRELNGTYRIDALRTSYEQPTHIASMLVLPDITVRLGVASFQYTKLEELLLRYSYGSSVIEVREIISLELDKALEKGKEEGGNVIISWDPSIWGFSRLPLR